MAEPCGVVLLRLDREAGSRSSHPRHLHPPLDLKYIQAALLQAGQGEPRLIDQWLQEGSRAALLETLLSPAPAIVVVKAASWCLAESLAVAKRLRAAGCVTIAVGQQVSHFARLAVEEWQPSYSLAILGEPEQQACKVILALLGGTAIEPLAAELTQRIADRAPFLVHDPDQLAVPRFTHQELADYPFPFPIPARAASRWGYLQSSRGCPYRCAHCSDVVRKSSGSELRLRDPVKVVDECEALLAAGAEAIFFEDDSFFCHKRHATALCNEIIRRGLRFPWITSSRADELSQELVAIGQRAGLVMVKVGVESGSPEVVERIGKSRDGGDWIERVAAAFGQLRHHGVGGIALFMVGMPGEEDADLERSMRLASEIRPDYIQVQIYCDYPDAPLASTALHAVAPSPLNLYHYQPSPSNRCALTETDLGRVQRRFYRRFYLRPGYMWGHLWRYWRYYLLPAAMWKKVGRLVTTVRYIVLPPTRGT